MVSEVYRYQLYRYIWGNNEKRKAMKGRMCRIIVCAGRMRSCAIEFLDNNQREIVSRNSIRLVK